MVLLKSKFYLYIFLIVLFLLYIFRNYQAPADYHTYKDIYDMYPLVYATDYSFWLLIGVSKFLGMTYGAFLNFVIIIMLVMTILSCKRLLILDARFIPVVFSPFFLMYSVNGLRQGLAGVFALYALSLPLRYSILPYIIAIYFHKSSLLVIVPILLTKIMELRNKLVRYLLFITAVLTTLLIIVIIPRYMPLTYNEITYNSATIIVRFFVAFLLLVYCFYYKAKFNIYMVGIIYLVLSLYTYFSAPLAASRFLYFAEFFLMISIMCTSRINDIKSKDIFIFFIFLYVILILLFPSVRMQYVE